MKFDDELTTRFVALRDADGARAPGIREIVARDSVDRRTTAARRTTVAIAALCVLVVGVLVTQHARADSALTSPAPRWQSPTTSLVPTGQSVLAPAPLLSSVLDGATTSTLWHKGD